MVVDSGRAGIHPDLIERLIINGLSKYLHLSPPFSFIDEESFMN